jgi:hypothetical protein
MDELPKRAKLSAGPSAITPDDIWTTADLTSGAHPALAIFSYTFIETVIQKIFSCGLKAPRVFENQISRRRGGGDVYITVKRSELLRILKLLLLYSVRILVSRNS